MSTKRKLTTLTLREKFDVINSINSGMKKKHVAAQYGIPPSTLSTIIKNEAEILLRYETSSNLSCKRRRLAAFPDLEECLLDWFKQCRDNNISVSGPMLREKAEEFSRSLGYSSFRASNGWWENFKKRHDFLFNKGCGENASVNNDLREEWIVELQNLIKNYEPKDVFNAGETGLFFKCLPDKTLSFKNEKCHSGNHSKDRLTILLATNMTGTEKLKPLVVGKAKKPLCFSGIQSLPLDYDANEKAWVTAEIFTRWLNKIDSKMVKKKRKILIFVENCTAHKTIPPLKAVEVAFFPTNTTSKLQPLDQGIIQDFKSFYKREIVRKLINDMEQQCASSINVLHAIRMIDKAWRSVSVATISNCFKSCGFLITQSEALEEPLEADTSLEPDWNVLRNVEVKLEDSLSCDDELATTGALIDADIDFVNLNADDDTDKRNHIDDVDQVDCKPIISTKEARAAVDTLRNYFEKCNGIEDRVFDSLHELEKLIDKNPANCPNQKR